MHDTERAERAILVALETEESADTLDARLEELAELAETAGVRVGEKVGQRRKAGDPAYLIGQGKAALDAAAADVIDEPHGQAW